MKVAGTFSGIGGLEAPFEELGHECVLMCDIWEPSQQVLESRFDCPLVPDVSVVAERGLPAGTHVLTAGFPCTDLSQAGRTAGIKGAESGLVRHVFTILDKSPRLEWLVLENVRNMLVLDGGDAMRFLTSELEARGFRWAYRLVDSRFTGVPQRRHRVIMVASRTHDPRQVLFADEASERAEENLRKDAFGFYWTEGLKGVGWGVDALPPLKGGSGLGIPSAPAIWIPDAPLGKRFGTPTIEHAEQLQGFPSGWTKAAATGKANSPRWKLVGNAVTLGVGRWVAGRLTSPGEPVVEVNGKPVGDRWPTSAWGGEGSAFAVEASTWPKCEEYTHLTDLVSAAELEPLSERASNGFLDRADRSSLRFADGFLDDLRAHAEAMADAD